MKAPLVLAWTVTGLASLGVGASLWQVSRIEEAEMAKATISPISPIRQSVNADFNVVDMGLFKIQKIRDGKAVRNEILRVEIEVYEDKKIKKLDQISPRLREDIYTALRKKMVFVPDTGRVSFNSPKLKKKLVAIARKHLGKGVAHDVKVTDHQKVVREMIKKRKLARNQRR